MSIHSTEGRAFTCQDCLMAFRPSKGGICSECNRILCDDHFYGSFWRRMLRVGTRCVACRAETSPAASASSQETH